MPKESVAELMTEKPIQLDYETPKPKASLVDLLFHTATVLICLAACYFIYLAIRVVLSPIARE